jgi:hypothetical protein
MDNDEITRQSEDSLLAYVGAGGKLSEGRCTFTICIHGWPRS